MTDKEKKKQSNAEKPISLKPLKFDEAVSDLLKVKPATHKIEATKSYWLAVGTYTNWSFCFDNDNVWGFSIYYRRSWERIKEGDALLCYAITPIKGIIGYCIIEKKQVGKNAVFPQEKGVNLLWPLHLILIPQKVLPTKDWANRSIKLDRTNITLQKALSKLPETRASEIIRKLNQTN